MAILALAGLAYAMKLGGKPILTSEAAARTAANEAVDGFVAADLAIDSKGEGALVRDKDGRILLLKPHGNKFAGRILGINSSATAQEGLLNVSSGERRFGSCVLKIDNAQAWAEAINAIKNKNHA